MGEFRRTPSQGPEIRIERETAFDSDSAMAHDGEEDEYRTTFDDGIDAVPLAVTSTVAVVADTPKRSCHRFIP